jgi:hypothetical protein
MPPELSCGRVCRRPRPLRCMTVASSHVHLHGINKTYLIFALNCVRCPYSHQGYGLLQSLEEGGLMLGSACMFMKLHEGTVTRRWRAACCHAVLRPLRRARGGRFYFLRPLLGVTPADGRAQLRSFFVRCRREAEAQAQSRSA